MRIQFRNVAMAAAFIGGVLAQGEKRENYCVEEHPDLSDLPMTGPVILDVVTTKQDENTFINIDDVSEDTSGVTHSVGTIMELNAWVNQVVPPVTGTNSRGGQQVRGNTVTFHRDGSLRVGCKTFNAGDVEKVARASKRVAAGLSFNEFITSTRHRVRPTNNNNRHIAIDDDGVVTPAEVEQIAAERAAFLATSTQANVPAFNLLA